ASAAHAVGLHALGQHWHQRDFARNVRCQNIWNHRAEYQRFDLGPAQIGPLEQLVNAQLAEFDRGEALEHSAGACERRSHARHNRDAAPVSKGRHCLNLDSRSALCYRAAARMAACAPSPFGIAIDADSRLLATLRYSPANTGFRAQKKPPIGRHSSAWFDSVQYRVRIL